jgi:glutamate-5-semialdehyde dehydrogenase
MTDIYEKAELAKAASFKLATISSSVKDDVLKVIADLIEEKKDEILIENKKDMDEARVSGIDESLVKRLGFTDDKINDMVKGLRDLAEMKDPVGRTLETVELDKGLDLYKISTPLGVVAAIFEARPDALVQIFSLAFKSGNASILKGGSEAKHSNRFLHSLIRSVTDNVVDNATILIETRDEVNTMLKMNDQIDLMIPRGSSKFVKFIQENSRIPVLGHSDGLCHAYVDKSANLEEAERLVYDAKMQYAAACNAIETLLVHKDVAVDFLPLIAKSFAERNVEIRCDFESKNILNGFSVKDATDADWDMEYNDYIISIKIVSDAAEAINHINLHGSKHSEMIITEDRAIAKKFEEEVDASSVMWNASTRFADGFRYGKGAETGISTGKIHARGPVGLEGLIIYKYIIEGHGQTVTEYSGPNGKNFVHERKDEEWTRE